MNPTVEQVEEIEERPPSSVNPDSLTELVHIAALGVEVEDCKGASMPML